MLDEKLDNLEDADYDTILAADIDFKGTLKFEHSFLVRGRIEGSISASGVLLVDEAAVVIADIRADTVIIRGSVKGNITAVRKVYITGTGRLSGDIETPQIQMDAGSVFNGHCGMETGVL